MRVTESPRRRGCGVRGLVLAAAVTALMTGMAAGLWPSGAGDASAVVVAGSAGSWGRATAVPGLAALNTGVLAEVISVSCVSSGNCAAAGDYSSQSGGQGFVAVERDGVWGKAIEVPGLGALNKAGIASVASVSCAPAGPCVAGGHYHDRLDHSQGFVVRQTG